MALVAVLPGPLAAGHYLSLGVLSISLTNALIILAMVLLFVVALFAPFPRYEPKVPRQRDPESVPVDRRSNGGRP